MLYRLLPTGMSALVLLAYGLAEGYWTDRWGPSTELASAVAGLLFGAVISVVAVLGDAAHAYDGLLSERDRSDLANFVTLAALWTGRLIAQLERGVQSNDVVSQIIAESIDQRVLSRYTAFIALEPSQGGEVCSGCEDETDEDVIAGTEEEQPALAQTTMEAYPNPFNDRVTVKAIFGEPVEASALTVRI